MKKTKLVFGAALTFTIAMAAKESAIMTVNGVDVPRSEFEYLYNKNSQQQLNPLSIDEYVEMFKLYKLKVADAKAEGLDTVADFKREMAQYKHELAAPYMTDSVFLNKLIDEAYDRSAEEVEAWHIMLFKARDTKDNIALRKRADSIAQAIHNGAKFEDMAAQYSQDRGSNFRGGLMGYITAGSYPYEFEKVAYSLPLNQISDVVETNVGYHVLRGGAHRPARGKVQAAHILKSTRNGADEATAKAQIDSIYAEAIANPAKFGELAKEFSDDKNSGRQGGMLPWFGAGEMVAEFDSVAFALKDGEISTPFRTDFGYHIIHKIASKARPARDEVKTMVIARTGTPQDGRYQEVRDAQSARLAKKHKAHLNDKTLTALRAAIAVRGMDSLFFEEWDTPVRQKMELCVIDGKKYHVSDIIDRMHKARRDDPEEASIYFEKILKSFYHGELVDAEQDLLLATIPDYSNLYREYVDGSLLYEVSKQKVWDKAASDAAGLQKYFDQHRSDYKWTEPKAKGYLVLAANDSVAALIKARAAEVSKDSLVTVLRKEFPRQISINKFLEPKGADAMIDNIMFGGPATTSKAQNFPIYFILEGRILEQPEELGDVRGLVTSDYQNEYQANWENELKKKYPVKVNEKELKKVQAKSK